MNRLGFSLLATGWLAACTGSRPAMELASPEPALLSEVDRGRALYLDHGCVLCHGPDGKGGVENPNAETEGKIPALVYVAEGYTPRELETKLMEGVRVVGKEDPKGPVPPLRMPGYQELMTSSERAVLVAYLFSLYPKGEEESWVEKK